MLPEGIVENKQIFFAGHVENIDAAKIASLTNQSIDVSPALLNLLHIYKHTRTQKISINKQDSKIMVTIADKNEEYDITEFADKSLDNLRIEYLRQKGLMPNETDSFTVGDKTIYHSKKFILDDSGRTGVLLFVPGEKNGNYKVRLAYTSQSQGIWRLLSMKTIMGYEKTGLGEDAISFGLDVQQNLSEIVNHADQSIDNNIIPIVTNILQPYNKNIIDPIIKTQDDIVIRNMNDYLGAESKFLHNIDLQNITDQDQKDFDAYVNKINKYIDKQDIDITKKQELESFLSTTKDNTNYQFKIKDLIELSYKIYKKQFMYKDGNINNDLLPSFDKIEHLPKMDTVITNVTDNKVVNPEDVNTSKSSHINRKYYKIPSKNGKILYLFVHNTPSDDVNDKIKAKLLINATYCAGIFYNNQ